VALEEAVGQQQQAVSFGQLEFVDRPLVTAQTKSETGSRFEPLHVVVPMYQHPGMPGAYSGEAQAVGSEGQAQERGEDSLRRALGEQDALELAHALVAAQSRERQSAPTDAQRHAERGLVRSMPGDVTDHDVHSPVRSLHDVVEIPS
jgi:hypothetical protein